MNQRITTHLAALAVVTLLLLGASQAFAGGTDADTTISNTASITYKVGTTSPPAISSTPATFKVDHKIRPLVAKDGDATVVPSGNDYWLKFTVTNDGNTKAAETLEIQLTTEASAADNFDMNNVEIWQDNGDGTFNSGTDSNITASPYITLAKDGNAVIFVVADTPGTATDNQTADYHLIATAWTGGAAGSALGEDIDGDDPNVSEAVWADDAGSATGDVTTNGKHSAMGTFTIGTAQLTISKSSAVIGGSGYYIPGETVEYTITISNAGVATATATDITVSDSLNAEITAGTVAFATGSIKVTAPNLYAGAENGLTDGNDADEGDWNVTGVNTVTVTGISLAPGESATVKFQVTIQ